MRRIPMTLLGLSLAVGSVGGAARAQEATSTDSPLAFGIMPAQASEADPTSSGYFTLYLEPGDQLVDEALVINRGDEPLHLRVYVAAANTAINGGTAFGHREDPSRGADWVDLDVAEVSLHPAESQIVPFTVSVPEDASPGDHVVGLVAEAVSATADAGIEDTAEEPQFALQVVQRVGVAVIIDVPGDRVAALDITDLRLSQQHAQGAVFAVDVSNTGNVMLNGHGSLTITDRPGKELATIAFDVDTVLAGDFTSFNIDHPVLLTDGDYMLNATIDYRAVRGGDTIQTAALGPIGLEVVDGQPKPQEMFDSAQSTEVAVIGADSQQGDTTSRTLTIYIVLAALAAAGVAAVAWQKSR